MDNSLKQASIDYCNDLAKMPKGAYEAITAIMRECFVAGAEWKEHQIMEHKAIRCRIQYAEIPHIGVVTTILPNSDIKCLGLESNDEVRIIIASKRKFKK